MKKVIYILSFILTLFYSCESIYAQTHSWIQLSSPQAGTYFQILGDTVYYIDNTDPSTFSGYMYKVYKGLNGSAIQVFNDANASLGGVSGYSGCGTWSNGTLYQYGDTLYNFNSGTNGYCGYFSREKVAYGRYNPTASYSSIYNNSSDYDIYGSQQSVIPLLNDTVFNFVNNYIYGSGADNRIFQYKISNGSSSYSSFITTLTNIRFNYWYRYVAGDFVIADTLYAITSYKSLEENGISTASDTTATIWKRNPITFAWDSVRSFSRAGFILNIENDTLGNAYFLLAGKDSSQSDCGLWKFDGNTFSKMLRPPSLLRVFGFHIVNPLYFFESVANSAVADSNKLYRYNGATWDSGQTIYNTAQTSNILINNITMLNSVVFVSKKQYPLNGMDAIGVGASAVAYDTNYYMVSVPSPSTGYYNLGNTITVQVSPNPSDSFYVYISYDGYYNFKGQTSGDSLRISLDTLSTNAIVKVVGISHGAIGFSQSFVIQSPKSLTITKVVFVTPPTTANINILVSTRGVSSMTAYYSTDSVVWKQIRQFSIPLLSTTHIDTLVTSIPFPMVDSAYFKVAEFYDTTTYDFNPAVQVGGYRAVPEGSICLSWSYSGFGSIWRQDLSCGWVGVIDILTGVTSISIGSDGNISSSTVYTDYVNYLSDVTNPIPGWTYIGTMPAARPWQVAPYPAYSTGSFGVTSAASPVTLNGRQYWWNNNILYQHDLVNNVTTQIMDKQYALGSGAVDFSDQVGIGSSNGFTLFANLPGHGWPNVIMIKNLPYPPDKSYTSLVSVYHNSSTAGAIDPGTGITYNTYRGMFRGIDPKIKR